MHFHRKINHSRSLSARIPKPITDSDSSWKTAPEFLREVSPAHRELLEHGRKKNIFFFISFDSLKKTKVMKNFLDFLDLIWWSYKVNNKKGVWEIAKKHVFQYFTCNSVIFQPFILSNISFERPHKTEQKSLLRGY